MWSWRANPVVRLLCLLLLSSRLQSARRKSDSGKMWKIKSRDDCFFFRLVFSFFFIKISPSYWQLSHVTRQSTPPLLRPGSKMLREGGCPSSDAQPPNKPKTAQSGLCELSGGPEHEILHQRRLTLNQVPATSAAHRWKADRKKSWQEFRKIFGSHPSLQPLLLTFLLNAKEGFPPPHRGLTALGKKENSLKSAPGRHSACHPAAVSGEHQPRKERENQEKDGGADIREVGLLPLPVNLSKASKEQWWCSAADQEPLTSLVVR